MKALIYKGPKTLEYTDVPKPEPKENEVVLRIKSVGICGTDLHIYNGGMNQPAPLIIGHEFSGEIESVGANAKKFRPGDRVVGEHVVPCRKCKYCSGGHPNLCTSAKVIGLDMPGAMAEYLAIPEDLVYKIPDSISFEEGALIEPLTIAVYAARQAAGLLDKNVAVIGQGPIGLLLDQVIKNSGGNVIGIESQEHRLKFAQDRKWIDFSIDAQAENVQSKVETISPCGADIVYEAVGREAAAETALNIAARAGHVFLLGVFENRVNIDLMKIVKKELKIQGSWTCAFSFPEAIDLVGKKKVDLASLITHRFPASEGAKAFKDASEYIGNRIKTVINF